MHDAILFLFIPQGVPGEALHGQVALRRVVVVHHDGARHDQRQQGALQVRDVPLEGQGRLLLQEQRAAGPPQAPHLLRDVQEDHHQGGISNGPQLTKTRFLAIFASF